MNKLIGGIGDKTKESEVCPIQLQMGIETEMEHTNDADKAREIALDHLTEDPQYYSKLEKMEHGDGNMKSFKEMLAKGKPVKEGMFKDAKMSMLKELQKAMGDSMSEDVKGLKKVTVASPDKEGLKEGLEKAKEMIGDIGPQGQSEEKEDEENESEEMESEEAEEEMEEAEESDPMAKIAELEKELAELKAQLAMK